MKALVNREDRLGYEHKILEVICGAFYFFFFKKSYDRLCFYCLILTMKHLNSEESLHSRQHYSYQSHGDRDNRIKVIEFKINVLIINFFLP